MKSGQVRLPDGDWWKDERVIDSDLVSKRAGYLLNKKESPFELINMADYEWIK